MLVGLLPRVRGKRPLLTPHTFVRFLNKINNLNDLFSQIVALMFNKKKNQQLYIVGAVNIIFFFLRRVFSPDVVFYIYIFIYYNYNIYSFNFSFFICKSLWIKASAK